MNLQRIRFFVLLSNFLSYLLFICILVEFLFYIDDDGYCNFEWVKRLSAWFIYARILWCSCSSCRLL